MPSRAQNPDRVRALLEEAAQLLGLGARPATIEVVLERGPKLTHVYRHERVNATELPALVDELRERTRAAGDTPPDSA